MRRWILLLLVLSCALLPTHTRKAKEVLKEEEEVQEEKATVLEADHFLSENEKEYSFEATEVEKDKPIVFLLQQANEQQSNYLFEENPLTVSITAGSQHQQCSLTHLFALCSLPNPDSDTAQFKIECKKTPCEAKWRIEQPETLQIDGNHTLNHLVSVNEHKDHAMLSVYCTDPELRTQLDDKIEMFTNSEYDKVVSDEGEVVFFFNNEEKGQYFISTGDKAIQACTVAHLEHAEDTVTLSKQGFTINDFLIPEKPNLYDLGSGLSTDLRIQVLLHDSMMKVIKNTTQLDIKLIGVNGKSENIVNRLTFDVDDEKEFTSFNLIFKQPTPAYQQYQLRLQTLTEHYLIIDMNFVLSDLHEVEFTEESYFNLKKGDKINYKMRALDEDEKNIQTVNIGISNPSAFTLSKNSCERSGCEFTVEAKEDGMGSIYVGQDVKKAKAAEVVEQQFQKSIGGKLRQGEQKFYLYKMKANDAIQMLVNSPNVIVYVANKAVCSGEKLTTCHQKEINYHNPSIYETKEPIELVFLVRALDSAQFVLTVIDAHQPYIELKDTEPFVYLMDNNEEHVALHFKIPQKEDVSFNLIAPLKELTMMILNKEGVDDLDSKKEAEEGEFTTDGSISYLKADLKSTSFIVVVSKREEYKSKFVHFTLIASTKQSNLILQPSNPHYQKLSPKSTRDYVFSLYPDKQLFVNFHVSNQLHPDLSFTLSNADEYSASNNTVAFPIQKQIDVLSLTNIGERLCKSRESECQLFARLTNPMPTDVEVTITIMLENSIIELKDGIWQNYDLNEAASSTHFYFLPKHQQHSTTIFYHSSMVDLKVAYALWHSDDTSIDVSQWPFPTDFSKSQSKDSPLQFKPPQFIHIGTAEMQKCWPKCVVLLSIIPEKQELEKLEESPTPAFTLNHQFKIMASNNLIQIPEKHKMDIVLNKDEDKFLLVDLKDYMERDTIVFFTYSTIGLTVIKANVYTEADPRCPTMEEFGADFNFAGIQTELEVEAIKKKLEENKMNEDHSPYLCLLAHAMTQSKFAIEFVPEARDIKALQLDTTTPLKLIANQVRIFEIHAHLEFYIKVSRTSGFPYVATKLCNPTADMEGCLDEFVNSNEKGTQLVNKIMSLTETPCADCMFYLKVTTAETTQLDIHAQSKLAEIELKENSALTDILAPAEVNKYLITGLPDKQLLVNVQILSGDLKVQINDLASISINKQNKKGETSLHIAIPTKQLKDAKTTLIPFLSAFLFSSSFVHLHLTVESQDPKAPASYVITYSNGQVETHLQDGLVSQYTLMPKKTSKFLYSNPSTSPIYLHLSTPEAETLNKLKVEIYSMENQSDEDSKTAIAIQREPFKKKTVNPTMLFSLPAKNNYVIEVQNENAKDVVFFIGVNNQEIIYLPTDHEFPFRLASKEYLYFVVSAATPGYLRFTLSKCDDSQPYLAFTDDYNDFVNENFETEEQITDTLIYDNVIKVKKAGSLYFKVRTEDTAPSTLTVKASLSSAKLSLNNAKAGNKGNLEYQFMDSETAEVIFSPVVCDKNCGDFAYSVIKSSDISGIFAQLVCTAVSFDLLGFTQTKHPQVLPIKATTTKDGKLAFNFPIKEDINYLGVKAVNSKSGAVVYYQPLEITTIRGKINRIMTSASQPRNLSWLIGTVIAVSICVLLLAYRRYNKNKQAYRPVNYDELQDSIN